MKVDQHARGVGAGNDRPFARNAIEVGRLEFHVVRDRPDGANLLDPPPPLFPAHRPRLAAQERANGVDFGFSHAYLPARVRAFYAAGVSIGQGAEFPWEA
jgi:hypothetical protein